MEEFSVTTTTSGAVSIMSVTGRVDSSTASQLDAQLDELIHKTNKIVLDLQGLAYLSSAGVRAIAKAAKATQKAGGGVKLASIPSLVAEVLELVGMNQILETFPTTDEAVKSF